MIAFCCLSLSTITEQMSDLEAVQNRLSATRSVFRFLLENRTTILPADAVIRRFAESSQRPEKAPAADQSVEEISAVDNSFDDSDWGDAKPSRLLPNPRQQQHQGKLSTLINCTCNCKLMLTSVVSTRVVRES